MVSGLDLSSSLLYSLSRSTGRTYAAQHHGVKARRRHRVDLREDRRRTNPRDRLGGGGLLEGK